MFFVVTGYSLTAQDFFPLEVGNLWVYETYFQGQFRGYSNNSIERDTVPGNGLQYVLRHNERAPIRMTDTLTTRIYDLFDWDNDTSTSDLLGDSLNASLGEEWTSHTFETQSLAKMEAYYSTSIFGEFTDVRIISHHEFNGFFIAEVHYSRKFGIIELQAEGGFSYYLVGAKINGASYGTLTFSATPIQPLDYKLGQNYPNPFNPRTTIQYTVPERSHILLKIYNLLGEVVQTLVDAESEAGTYTVSFDASDLPSGMYIYRLVSENYVSSKKMIVLK